MALATQKTTSIRELILLDLVMTGEASQMAGCDRRTFKAWARKLKVEPAGTVKGNKEVYKRVDAERVAKAYKSFLSTSKTSG